MTDNFDKFETYILTWCSNHKVALMLAGFFVVAWVIISIWITSMLGIGGAGYVDGYITEAHYNGTGMDDDAFKIYEDWMVPAVVQMFNTMGWLMIIFGGGYLFIVGYTAFKYLYRRGRVDDTGN